MVRTNGTLPYHCYRATNATDARIGCVPTLPESPYRCVGQFANTGRDPTVLRGIQDALLFSFHAAMSLDRQALLSSAVCSLRKAQNNVKLGQRLFNDGQAPSPKIFSALSRRRLERFHPRACSSVARALEKGKERRRFCGF
jgi:hypothetical protein